MSASHDDADHPLLPFTEPIELDDAELESILHPAFEECDDDVLLELDDEYWDALLPEDEYEVQPEEGDFWIDRDAA